MGEDIAQEEHGGGPGRLEVVGVATRAAVPDMVTLTFVIRSGGPSAAQALRDNAARAVRVAQALLATGIEQADLQTSGVTIQPQPRPPAGPPHGPPRQPSPGYLVNATLTVTLRDLGRVGEAIDAALGAGAGYGGMTLGLQDEAAARREVLELAAADGQTRAEVLAAVAGKRLGALVAMAEEFGARPGEASGRGGGSTAAPGALSVHARVRLQYEVE